MARRNKARDPPVTLGKENASMVSEPYADELEEEVGNDLGTAIGRPESSARLQEDIGIEPSMRVNPWELIRDGWISQKDGRNDINLHDLDERTRNREEGMDQRFKSLEERFLFEV